MAYPAAITSFSSKTDGADDVLAAHMNAVQTDITAIETELGTDPAGTVTDVKTRLAVSLSGAGLLQFATATTLTIATGSITTTQNWHRIDTEAAAATDDLDTITAASEARFLIVRSVSGARNVVIKHGTGNIYCTSGIDITLDNNYDLAILIYDATLSFWIATCVSAAVLLAGGNTLTGTLTPAGGMRWSSVTKTGNYTATIRDDEILVDATGASYTITLPSVATSTGVQLLVKKIDSSGNAVVIDGNASETIDGATTKSLTTQYQSYILRCNGTTWSIY